MALLTNDNDGYIQHSGRYRYPGGAVQLSESPPFPASSDRCPDDHVPRTFAGPDSAGPGQSLGQCGGQGGPGLAGKAAFFQDAFGGNAWFSPVCRRLEDKPGGARRPLAADRPAGRGRNGGINDSGGRNELAAFPILGGFHVSFLLSGLRLPHLSHRSHSRTQSF